jgi:VWFA-related protein
MKKNVLILRSTLFFEVAMLLWDAGSILGKRCFIAAGLLSFICVQSSGQNPSQQPHRIRVGVALVQTDVMVFDRNNRFVDDLKPEQFDFRVDGKAQPISFFDLVYSGTPRDEEIWAKLDRKAMPDQSAPRKAPARTGRTILFFVDDWHLSAESMMRARAALQNLIDTSVGVSDQAAIVTASGQLGFLQQFTSDRSVLRVTVAKLAGGSVIEDREYPPMNEAIAARIIQGDTALFDHYVALRLRKFGETPTMARMVIHGKTIALANASAVMAERSLAALQDFIRSASARPGRKLVFFLSDGFALQLKVSDIVDRLRRLTTAAANAGTVIYTMDTRGLVVGLPDAKSPLPPLGTTSYNDVMDFQDGLNALAADTGGRFLHNTNALDTAIATAMAEASRYYLLGWYADAESLKPGKYWSLKVSVRDRPDLKVRLRAGSVDLSQSVPMLQGKRYKPVVNAKDAPTQLRHALEAPFPFSDVAVSLYAGWVLDPEKGPVVAISYQIDLDPESAREQAKAEVMGGVADKDGVTVESFSETLSPPGGVPPGKSGTVALKYIRKLYLEPGLYQIRVAARDPVTGELGSAWQWIQVPAKVAGKMWLSSIFLREQSTGSAPADVRLDLDAVSNARFSIQRRFTPNSEVKFYVNVHDAAGTDLLIRTAIFQGNQPIVQTPLQKITSSPAHGEQHFVPVSGGLSFRDLAPGTYTFEVAITDSLTNAQLVERVPFAVEQNTSSGH